MTENSALFCAIVYVGQCFSFFVS